MSTNINITVSGNSLIDQAQAQQQAARQAQLEKENRLKLERDATRERTAQERGTVGAGPGPGRNATAAPVNGSLRRSSPLLDEPAAQRSSAELGFFWYASTTETENQLSYEHFRVASGDGLKIINAQFENPDLTSYLIANRTPHVAPTSNIAGNTHLSLFDSWEAAGTKNWIYRDNTCTSRSTVSLPNPKYPAPLQPEFLTRDVYEKEQVYVSQSVAVATYYITTMLPLGKDSVLFVAYRHQYGCEVTTTIRERRKQTPIEIELDAAGLFTRTNYLFTSEEAAAASTNTSPTSQEDYLAIRVSHTTAEQVDLPLGLLTRLRSKRGNTALTSTSEDYTLFFGNTPSEFSEAPIEACTHPNDDPSSFLTSSFGAFPGPLSSGLAGFAYSFSSPERTGESYFDLPAYGISYQGSLSTFASPMAWFDLDTDAPSVTLYTHEDCLNYESPRISGSVSSKLRVTAQLGEPASLSNLILNYPPEKIKYRKAKTYFSGSIYSQGYSYSNAAFWSSPQAVLKKGKTGSLPFSLATPYVIYDWGNPSFCRAEFSRYSP